jgi:hypothetical protein
MTVMSRTDFDWMSVLHDLADRRRVGRHAAAFREPLGGPLEHHQTLPLRKCAAHLKILGREAFQQRETREAQSVYDCTE